MPKKLKKKKKSPIKLPFRPRARLLQLLGDQLIGNPRLAIFELVKNAYDADADNVTVSLMELGGADAHIVVLDDGEGMDLDTIKNIWLIPGDDHREQQRDRNEFTTKGRLPLGEKGLGRFAAHKLGDEIELITRASGSDECVVRINWAELLKVKFLEDALVTVISRKPELFQNKRTGTRITIRSLRGKPWNKGEVRRLARQILSISSPFTLSVLDPKKKKLPIRDFTTTLEVPGNEDFLIGVPSVKDILGMAFWRCQFRFDEEGFKWSYEFRRIPELALEGRKIRGVEDALEVPEIGGDDQREEVGSKQKVVVASREMTEGIGAISGEFFIFDLDLKVRQFVPRLSTARNFLSRNGGVRIYRDGVRVYNYGEPGDDWLGLDLWRLNNPTKGISKNIVTGAINIGLKESSHGLVEKSSREGFVENEEFSNLQAVVIGALSFFANERWNDKHRIRLVTEKEVDPEIEKIRRPLGELRSYAEDKGFLPDLEDYIRKIELDFEDMQQTMLQAGMPPLSVTLVFHEVVRGVNALTKAISEGVTRKDLAEQAVHLNRLLEDINDLLRTDERKMQPIAPAVRQALRFLKGRTKFHGIEVVAPVVQLAEMDFEANYAFGMLLNVLTNVIDNAIHWMRLRWPENNDPKNSRRKLYIGVSENLGDGPALVLADTGTGFRKEDTPERLTRPFFSRKVRDDGKRGTGLGLYFTNMALELNGAKLLFPDAASAEVPGEFDGAVVAFLFEDT